VPERIRKQSADDIEFSTDFIVSPNTLWPDFYFLEISRGCLYNCKFCMLGKIYANRYRSHKTVIKIAEKARELTDKMRLVSATEDTHPEINRILRDLKDMGFQIIVGSQRADWVSDDFASYIDNKTFTVAPETGSDRLRRLIGKHMTNEEIMDAIRTVRKDRLDELQLYLMVGLPNETPHDIEETANLIRTVRTTLDREGYQHLKVRASINCFIPKPHTGFQYERQLTYDEYKSVIDRVRELVGGLEGVEFTTMDEKSVLTQGIVTRGDRRVGRAMYDALKKGDDITAWKSITCNNGSTERLFGRKESQWIAPWSFVDMTTTGIPATYIARVVKGVDYATK
ncbi:MAG: radical SAM protein, partial [Candidatus Aenigmatarchaeota archaeon]